MLATWMSGPLIRQRVLNDASFRNAMEGYLVADFRSYTERGGAKGAAFQTKWEGMNSTEYPGAGPGTYDTYAPLTYDAVYAIAHAIHGVLTTGASVPNPITVDSMPHMSSGSAIQSPKDGRVPRCDRYGEV